MVSTEDTPFSSMTAGPSPWTGLTHSEAKDEKLQRLYGISLEEFQRMLESQSGRCAICKVLMIPYGRHGNSVTIDHDHKTGQVRGLLCKLCNLALAFVEKDLAWGIKAARYLRKFVRPQIAQKSEDSKLEVLTCRGLVAPTHNTKDAGNPYGAGDSPQSCGSRNS